MLDRDDPLAPFRDEFAIPDGVIYLDGNSLGALPRATPARIAEVVAREWGEGLIRSWNDAGWITLAGRIAEKIARVIGAPAGSVAVGDSTSVNVFKALAAAIALRPARRTILSESGNFPTDLYIAEGLAALLDRGHGLRTVAPEEVIGAIDDDTAVVMLTHVSYHTGAMHDMAATTAAAHGRGALMMWDLAHSAGAVPVDLGAVDADLAVGCGYKFLNGGPGAPAFLYVAPRLHETVRMPLTGWFGHARPFAFEPSFRAAPGIAPAQVGTPPLLSLAALEVGVGIALRAPIADIREKSLRQSAIFAELVTERCGPATFRLVTPTEPSRRGSQVCLAHPHAYPIMQALIARGVIGDFRAPDILRFGITPLTLTYAELWDAAEVLAEIMRTESWRDPRFAVRHAVT
ncbi:MAG TPA: kynureninase [Acetobacteraceae bacterium]|nr:kynureninase [Acetobacteraceae bacterium]